MPIVLVQYKAGCDFEPLVAALAGEMPGIVASALDSSKNDGLNARLVPDDIEVWCNESGELDVNTKDLEIVIWAHDFPSRRASLEQRKDEIIAGVHKILADYDRNLSGFVWVLLQPTAFGTL